MTTRCYKLLTAVFLVILLGAMERAPGAAILHISVNRATTGEGQTVFVSARLAPGRGRRKQNVTLWPYLNGKQWGAPARTNQAGLATLPLPLPEPGIARIQVALSPARHVPPADWIWSHKLADHQKVYFQKQFHLGRGGRAAGMLLLCDDTCTAWLNGHEIGSGALWRVAHLHHLGRFLKPGENVLSVRGYNDTGPAGLLARLTIHTTAGTKVIITNRAWRCFAAKPAGWPAAAAGATKLAQPVQVIAPVGGGVWGGSIQGWPGIYRWNFPVGEPLPVKVLISNIVPVRVTARKFSVPAPRRHLVGIDYEPWFTPLNVTWSTAEAIPLLGKYPSINPLVIRQHALWLDKMGINYILIDWSNNLWGKNHWSQRAPNVRELIHATTVLMKTYANMRRQGIVTPQVTLLLGLINGPAPASTTALNEEMAWIYRNYVQNPRMAGLWLHYRHKPLIVLFNGMGPAFLAGKLAGGEPPINQRQFTVRWMGSQLQESPALVHAGYWSWMDGSIRPIPTYNHGQCESLTITPAFFGKGGWLFPEARARDNGFTYLREFNAAIQYRPHFLTICQWNEFAGQPIGAGYGPKHNIYVDCYNVHLNNDIEPTSLTDCAYRGCGGWGFYYLNLTRACVHLYHQKHPSTSVMAIGLPHRGQKIKPRRITMRWVCVGKAPKSFSLRLDGKIIARHISPLRRAYTVDLRGVAPGRHTLELRAVGCRSRFRISYTREAHRLHRAIAARAHVDFVVR